jgi:hypothetical protein
LNWRKRVMVICSPALTASGRAAGWVMAQQRQQQCDAEADLEQDLQRIQPAPARHPHAQRPGAPAGYCLQQQQQQHRPQTLLATKKCLPIPTSGGRLNVCFEF